jgi:uncharacterized protein (DUF58 family)
MTRTENAKRSFIRHPLSAIRDLSSVIRHPSSIIPYLSSAERTAISRQGWYYLALWAAILTLGLLRQMNLVLVLAGMMAGPLVCNWRLAVRGLRGLQVVRRAPPSVCAGDTLVVELEVACARPRLGSWALWVRDAVEREGAGPDEPPIRPEVLVPYLPAGQTRSAAYRGQLPRRGLYHFGSIELATGFPFGLFRRIAVCRRPGRLYVYPRLGRLGRRGLRPSREAFEGSQHRERCSGQASGDFFGVRQWQRGDSRRWIHWRATARHGSIVVRQFERYRREDLAVLVDLWQPARPVDRDRDCVELAVSFAATVVAERCRGGGGELLLGVGGAGFQWAEGPASAGLLQDAMEKLATAEAGCEDRLAALLQTACERVDPGMEVLLVTTRPVEFSADDPAWRRLSGRTRLVDASSPQLRDYFEVG